MKKLYEFVACYDDDGRGQCGLNSSILITSCDCGFCGPVCVFHMNKHFDEHKNCILNKLDKNWIKA